MVSVRLSFYDSRIVERVKEVPGRRFSADQGPHWLIPQGQLQRVLQTFPYARIEPSLSLLVKERTETMQMAHAEDAPHPADMACALYAYQRAGVAFLRKLDSALLYDSPGLGKTRQAVGWALPRIDRADLRVRGLYGCLVVCPATMKPFWEREILTANPKAKTWIVSGRSGDQDWDGKPLAALAPPGTEWVIVNWDILLAPAKEKDADGTTKTVMKGRLAQIKAHGFAACIYSEVHYAKSGQKSLRGQASLEIAEAVPCRLCESGTPTPNRPKELLPVLQILGKVTKKESFHWLKHFCDGKQIVINRRGDRKWDFSGASNTAELAESIKSFAIGRKKEQILKDLPPITYSFPVVELSNAVEYKEQVESLYALLDELVQLGGRDDYELDEETTAEIRRLKGAILSKRTALLMLTAKGKVDAVREILQPYYDDKRKTIVFCEFLDPLYELEQHFPACVMLTGEVEAGTERDARIQQFQTDPDILVAFGGRKAIGYGPTLTAAETAIFASLPWNPSDWTQARDRGAIRADNLKRAKNIHCISVLAEKSMDQPITQLIYGKAGVIESTFFPGREDATLMARFREMTRLVG